MSLLQQVEHSKVLIRSIHPYYDDESKLLKPNESYLFKDNGMVVFPTNYPNIVGLNTSGHSQCRDGEVKKGVQWNDNYNKKSP